MNAIKSGIKRNCFALFLIAVFISAGCTYAVKPGNIPLVTENGGDSFKGVSVLIQNAGKDDAESRILTEAGKNSPFNTNKRALSQTLTESLARELARRGAEVRVSSPIKFSVAVSDIVFVETREMLQFRAKAVVASSEWTKEYEGTASMQAYEVYSLSRDAVRLAGRALSDVVRAIIEDADFAAQLKTKQ